MRLLEKHLRGFQIYQIMALGEKEQTFLDKELQFGEWGSDFLIRLARKSACKFDLKKIHEKMLVKEKVGRLTNIIIIMLEVIFTQYLKNKKRYILLVMK